MIDIIQFQVFVKVARVGQPFNAKCEENVLTELIKLKIK